MKRNLFAAAALTSIAALTALPCFSAAAYADEDSQSEINQLKAENKELKAEMQQLAARFDKLEKTEKKQLSKVDEIKQQQGAEAVKIDAKVDALQQQQKQATQASLLEPAAGGHGEHAMADNAPVNNRWAGRYIGADAGLGYNSFSFSSNVPTFDLGPINSFSFLPDIKAGYRWQSGATVFGVEGDAGYNAGSQTSHTIVPIGTSATYSGKSTVQGTLRGVAGLASDRSLVYLTAGSILARVDQNFAAHGLPGGTLDGTDLGVIGGIGYDYAIDERLSLDFGYTDSWFPQKSVALAGFGNAFNYSPSLQEFKVGASYKF